ncbi:unnamed protein product [Dibothriocephalus latus]|uniref:Uncharacterized protein n=1 Tax=Dibothriocephalus latus TaxID=60516 RepID=A0A3P7N0Y4_DIBLA|nr:unnamed protein product [Dibothriocephalus latus]
MTSLSLSLILAVAQELLCQASPAYPMLEVKDVKEYAKSEDLHLNAMHERDADDEESTSNGEGEFKELLAPASWESYNKYRSSRSYEERVRLCVRLHGSSTSWWFMKCMGIK